IDARHRRAQLALRVRRPRARPRQGVRARLRGGQRRHGQRQHRGVAPAQHPGRDARGGGAPRRGRPHRWRRGDPRRLDSGTASGPQRGAGGADRPARTRAAERGRLHDLPRVARTGNATRSFLGAAMTTVRVDDHDHGVRLLTLDRPPANALDETLLADLDAALAAAAETSSVRAVVLTGAGTFFSGGFDLRAPRRGAAATVEIGRLYRDSHLRLLALPKPTIAMVGGHAIAGGFVLALACDYRLGLAGDYRIGLNEVAIGASFPLVAFEIVRLRLPHARAAETMLGAAIYPASQGPPPGPVDELLPAEDFRATVLRRATR